MLDQSLSYDSFMDSDSQEDAPLNQRRRRREGRGREEEEAMERAAYLPNTCNVREPPRRCDIQRHSRKSFNQRYQLWRIIIMKKRSIYQYNVAMQNFHSVMFLLFHTPIND